MCPLVLEEITIPLLLLLGSMICSLVLEEITIPNYIISGRARNNNTRIRLQFEKINSNPLKTRLQLNQTRPIKGGTGL